jgi:hypothetical protein
MGAKPYEQMCLHDHDQRRYAVHLPVCTMKSKKACPCIFREYMTDTTFVQHMPRGEYHTPTPRMKK